MRKLQTLYAKEPVEVYFLPGNWIEKCIEDARVLAQEIDAPVFGEFNGRMLIVSPDGTAQHPLIGTLPPRIFTPIALPSTALKLRITNHLLEEDSVTEAGMVEKAAALAGINRE